MPDDDMPPSGGGGPETTASPGSGASPGGVGLERSDTPGGTPGTPNPPGSDAPSGLTPPSGAPNTGQSMPAPGALMIGRAHMGKALEHMFFAIRTLPPGEDHEIAMKAYNHLIKHFKSQQPIQGNAPQFMRPNLPQIPGMGGPGGPPPGAGGPPGVAGGQGQTLTQPLLPRGPVPVPQGGGMPG